MKWLLLCNPNKWFYNIKNNIYVNELLLNLGVEGSGYETELWRLNTNSSIKMDEKINDGDLGIIKVGRDSRSQKIRTHKNNKIEKELESGIYAIFKFISTEYNSNEPKKEEDLISKEKYIQLNKMLWKDQYGDIFAKIKVIHNFFRDNEIITKDEAIKIMGKNLFESRGSRDISNEIFDKLFNFKKFLQIHIEDDNNTYQIDIHNAILSKEKIEDKPEPKKTILRQSKNNFYPRNPSIAKYALKEANFKCELDKNHTTFKSKALNENYVEAHHLIPMSLQENFEFSLDVLANIISLCPNCHRMLHFGIKKDVNKALEILYKQRRNRLKNANLNIILNDLKEMYNSTT